MPGAPSMNAVMQALADAPAKNQRLKRGDFDLSNGTANQRSQIASYEAELPLALRDDVPVRLMFIVRDDFTTDGTAGNTETFSLSEDLIKSDNTTDFVLFENSGRVSADAVSYSGNSFDYTDDGTANELHAYYVARDPVQVQVEKSAPGSATISEPLFEVPSSILHERNQNKDGVTMDFDDGRPLHPIVPRKWSVDIYADGPAAFKWNDDDATTSNGTTAVNAIVSIPVARAERDIEGLSEAVKQDVVANG